MKRTVPVRISFPVRVMLLVSMFALQNLDSTAQTGFREGFVIKNNGDTLVGWVFYSLDTRFRKQCRFKRFEIAPEVVYHPDDIAAFGFRNGRFFVSFSNDRKTRFYECLARGPVSRYQLAGKGSPIIERPDTSGVRKVVEYNRTPRAGIWNDYSVTRTAPLWKVDVTAGYQFVRMHIPGAEPTSYFNEAHYDYSYRPVAGLSLNRSISRKMDMASLNLSIIYNSDSYHGYAAYRTVADCRDELFIHYKGLQIPFSVQFCLKGRFLRPYCKVGIYATLMLQTEYFRFSERQFGQEIFIDRYHDFDPGNDFGYFGGLGTEIHAGHLRFVKIEMWLMQGSQYLNYNGLMYSEPYSTRIRSSVFAIMLNVNL